MTSIGKKRYLLSIEQKTDKRGSFGETADDWREFGQVYGGIEPLSGRELLNADQVQADVTHRIVARFVTGVTPETRVRFHGRVFNILSATNIEERNRELEILAGGRVSGVANVFLTISGDMEVVRGSPRGAKGCAHGSPGDGRGGPPDEQRSETTGTGPQQGLAEVDHHQDQDLPASGAIVAIIGPSTSYVTEFKGKKVRPANYATWSKTGTWSRPGRRQARPASRRGSSARAKRDGVTRKARAPAPPRGPKWNRSGNPFMKAAFNSTKAQSQEILNDKLREGIQRKAAKG